MTNFRKQRVNIILVFKLFFILMVAGFYYTNPAFAEESCLRIPIEGDLTYLRLQDLETLREFGKRVNEAVNRFKEEGLARPVHILITGLPASKKTNLIESLMEILNNDGVAAVFIKYDHPSEYYGKTTVDIDEKNSDAKVIIIEGTTAIPRDPENIDLYVRTEASDGNRQHWAMHEVGGSYELGQIIASAVSPEHMPKYSDRDPDIVIRTEFFDKEFITSGKMTGQLRRGYLESQTSL